MARPPNPNEYPEREKSGKRTREPSDGEGEMFRLSPGSGEENPHPSWIRESPGFRIWEEPVDLPRPPARHGTSSDGAWGYYDGENEENEPGIL